MTLLALTLAGLLACDKDDSDGPAVELDTICDPLDPSVCALPYPSSFYQPEDASTASGVRVAYAETSLPENRDDVQLNPETWNRKDGYSTLTNILFFFENPSLDGTIRHWEIERYEEADALTVLIDTVTGERVGHWVELDDAAPEDAERLMLIHPAVPLEHGRRYVVGLRGLVDSSGATQPASEAFAAMRDAQDAELHHSADRIEHFDSVVFPALEAQGFSRGELQLAWDFVTVSRESSLGPAEFMRDDLMEFLGGGAPEYSITNAYDEDCSSGATIGRTIEGEFTVPLYTDQDEAPAFLTRDDDGMPYRNGTTQVPFLVRVPCTLLTDPRPARILQYGHGLLGSRGEAYTGWLSSLANDAGYVVVAVDWKGMAEDDVSEITWMLVDDPSRFNMIPERSLQGFVEQIAALELARHGLSQDEQLIIDGVELLSPDRFGYYGNSQGGILGGGYMGMSPVLERGVLGVGGMPYGLLLTRSSDFEPFFLVFKEKFTDHREITLIIALMQALWDPGETAGWSHVINREPAEGVPAKQVLLQIAMGDSQVTPLGAHMQARALGAHTVAPETRAVWGVSEQAAGFTGSALVEWYYPDGAEEPDEALPTDPDLDTHECPRREPAAQAQIIDFLETGVIQQHCEGICEGSRLETCD